MIFRAPLGDLGAWAKDFVRDLNRFHPTISRLPTFADDTAAAAGNLPVGQGYATPTGEIRRRVG
jgi:hypothetical protein